jgi:DNA uptake protein ComE-like DNA-binding protein
MARAVHLSRRLALVLALAVPVARGARGQARPALPAHDSGLIDLNSASRDELMALDGIGEVRADAIIRARPFRAKTELVERWIIPEALYDKLADKVTVRPTASAPPPPSARPAAPPARR